MSSGPTHWIILFCAGALEAAFGYPPWLYAWLRHPVVWIGACINGLERNLNSLRFSPMTRRALGMAAMVFLLALTLSGTLIIQWFGPVMETLCIAALLAQRSLYNHVRAVLDAPGLEQAREKVALIVGRDVNALDQAGVNRAAIESLSESFSDGVVAPLFWATCFGLPGIACYKAINTADSMIGHKDERYRAFGWAAARLDDIANYLPARLSAVLIALAAASRQAWRMARRDARAHASPNAGWPEAAMAGALRLRLGGPQIYDRVAHEATFLGDGPREATQEHLRKALKIYLRACVLLWLMPGLALLATVAFR